MQRTYLVQLVLATLRVEDGRLVAVVSKMAGRYEAISPYFFNLVSELRLESKGSTLTLVDM